MFFVLKYIQNDIKDKYPFQLHNKNSIDSSLHYTPLLFYFREFPGIPWGFPITKNRYQGISHSGQDHSRLMVFEQEEEAFLPLR